MGFIQYTIPQSYELLYHSIAFSRSKINIFHEILVFMISMIKHGVNRCGCNLYVVGY